MNPADVASTVAAAPVAEVTVLGMFLQASLIVKFVMLGLMGASIWSWAIIINKSILFARTQRAMDKFPKQGARKPWKVHQNYALDLMSLRYGSVDNEMVFSNPVPKPERKAA